MNDQGEPVDDDTRGEDFCKLLIELGKVQLQSLDHIEALKDAGLEVETSESLIRQTKSLFSDKRVLERLGRLSDFQLQKRDGLPDIELHIRALHELIQDLYDRGKCPLTLTHGDITENVLKAADGSIVLFDWGAAKIDIPLCDVFCFHGSVTPEVIAQYLGLWQKYATASELRHLLHISSIIGGVVSMFGGFYGDGWALDDEDVELLARSLVDAKQYTEKRNQ